MATRERCNSSSGKIIGALWACVHFLLSIGEMSQCSICSSIVSSFSILNLWRQKKLRWRAEMDGVNSFLRREAPWFYFLSEERFHDLGNAVRSPSPAGADEAGGGWLKPHLTDAPPWRRVSDLPSRQVIALNKHLSSRPPFLLPPLLLCSDDFITQQNKHKNHTKKELFLLLWFDLFISICQTNFSYQGFK